MTHGGSELGQMYVMGERFRKNIDKFGEGTTELINYDRGMQKW